MYVYIRGLRYAMVYTAGQNGGNIFDPNTETDRSSVRLTAFVFIHWAGVVVQRAFNVSSEYQGCHPDDTKLEQ